MATYNLRRFSSVGELKAIDPEHLLALLHPHRTYFSGRGVILPAPAAAAGMDYEQLVEVLMTPDADTPKALVDALYFVHEMATLPVMDVLIDEAEDRNIHLDEKPDPTPADVAIQVYLQDRELVERTHAEQYLTKPRSFEYFHTRKHPIPPFTLPSTETLAALAADLDDWLVRKKRGRGSQVFVYPKTDAIWFLVRHGDPLRREGSLDRGQSSSVFYRPEKYDVLVYDPDLGEMRMHACSKGEKELFRRQFGCHLFGDEDYFPGLGKYTLEPLLTHAEAAIVCTDVSGMEWVRLKEIQYSWGGPHKEIEIRRGNDMFAAYAERGRTLPRAARILGASFQIKFADAKTARTVAIRPSNIAHYTRDSDADVVEDWLTRRGFIISEPREDEA